MKLRKAIATFGAVGALTIGGTGIAQAQTSEPVAQETVDDDDDDGDNTGLLGLLGLLGLAGLAGLKRRDRNRDVDYPNRSGGATSTGR